MGKSSISFNAKYIFDIQFMKAVMEFITGCDNLFSNVDKYLV